MRTAALVLLVACAAQKAPSAKHEMFSQPDAYERFMGRWSHLVALQLIELAEIHDGAAVLDVGSGTGALSFAIRDTTKAGRIVGVDPSSEYVEFATKHGDARTHFEVGDGQALHGSSAEFDRTLALLVLNFIPDHERAAREMVRVTKPGGIVVRRSGTTATAWRCSACSGTRSMRSIRRWRRATRPTCRCRTRASWQRCGPRPG